MVMSTTGFRALGSAIVLAAALGVPTHANAANFFEQLFGGGAPAPEQQVPSYAPGPEMSAPGDFPGEPSLRRRRHIIVARSEPVRQKTTDLMHDKTLRPGDAVVTKSGIKVYDGSYTSHHDWDQFVSLNDADMAPKEKQALVAMDPTKVDPLANAPLREGRSSSESSSKVVSDGLPITKGFKVTDARGNSVRYVGP